MEKVIYEGPAYGFYAYSSFRKFMEGKNARHIDHNFDLTNNIFQIWELLGVNVDYRHNGSAFDGIASIRLEGENTEKIKGVEQLILAGPDIKEGN